MLIMCIPHSFLTFSYPGVPSGIQEEKGIKYIFQVYEKDQLQQDE